MAMSRYRRVQPLDIPDNVHDRRHSEVETIGPSLSQSGNYIETELECVATTKKINSRQTISQALSTMRVLTSPLLFIAEYRDDN